MAEKHTPGRFTVERSISVGYRGGERFTGWKVVQDGKMVHLHQYKVSAQEDAASRNRAAKYSILLTLKANIDASLRVNSLPEPALTFDEWTAVSAAIAKATGAAA